MKTNIILLLIVGIVGVIANPVSKSEILSNEPRGNPKEPPLPETSEVEVKLELEDTTLNKNDPEPIKVEVISEEILPEPEAGGDTTDGEVDIVIEESVTPLEEIVTPLEEIVTPLEEESVTPLREVISDEQNEIKIDDNDYLYPGDQLIDNILANRIKDEIMETAAGFAPLPFLRKRHKQPARRRFAIRRHFQRYPYAPYRRLPFYNPYYRFYRPSSLRFY